MDIRDTHEWYDITDTFFENLGYLCDESAVEVYYQRDFAGPGGDWDLYRIFIEGCDSGEQKIIYAVNDQGDGRYNGYDFEGLTRAIAEFIAEGANGQIEVDNGDAFTIVF